MIKSADVKLELKKAQEVVKSAELKAILKVIEVTIKIVLNNRFNTVKIMEKLEVEKAKPLVDKDEEKE